MMETVIIPHSKVCHDLRPSKRIIEYEYDVHRTLAIETSP